MNRRSEKELRVKLKHMAAQLAEAQSEVTRWSALTQNLADLLAEAMELSEIYEVQQGENTYELEDGHLVVTSQIETVH
jgi:hypothetical protein